MAVHTYVGARYIPRFIGTYDPTQIYDALDVVDNGSGTSYIARKTVPAGTPLTDSDFWFVYGAASGAIVNLQNQIDTINNTDLPAINSEIGKIETLIAPKDRNIIIIGDSYGMKNTPNYLSFLTARFPDNIRGTALSSYSFIPFNLSGKWFKDILDDYYTSILTIEEKEAVTDIVVLGGWNDAHRIALGEADGNAILNKIHEFAAHATTEYPNSRVWIGFVGWQSYDAIATTPPGETYPTFDNLRSAELVYTNPCYPNVHVLDTPRYVLRNPNCLDATYFHPNGVGGTYLAYALINELMGHNSYSARYSLAKSDMSNTGIVDTVYNFDICQCNETVNFYTYMELNGTIASSVLCVMNPLKTPGVMLNTAVYTEALFDGTINGAAYSGPLIMGFTPSNEIVLYKPGVHSINGPVAGRVTCRGSFNNKYNI